MTFEQIQKDARSWLVTVSGLDDNKVIFANQNAPKPEYDFIVFNPSLLIKKFGNDEKVYNDDGTITVIQRRQADTSVNVYGPNAQSIIQSIQDSLDLPVSEQYFDIKGFVFIAASEARNLTFLEDKKWQQRWQADFFIRFSTQITPDIEDVGFIEEFEVNSNDLAPDHAIQDYPVIDVNIEILS